MSGMFEVLAASDDEHKIAQQQVNDRLAAAVYDVRQEFGISCSRAADIHEFRRPGALGQPDMMRVIDRHIFASGLRRDRQDRARRGSILEKEFSRSARLWREQERRS